MKRPTVVKSTEPARLPTHATGLTLYWDDEKNQPDPVTAADIENYDVREAAETFLAEYEAWKQIEADQAEAEARRLYAEHVARHLVGVFPNARVAADAYATAIGEELGNRSADLLKLVAQRVRRTSKTLPPIAALVEMVEAEASKRHRQAAAYRKGMTAHADAIAAGRRTAQEMAAEIALHAPDIDADAIADLWKLLAVVPLGITLPTSWRDAQQTAADLRRLVKLMQNGDADAIETARGAVAELRTASAQCTAAEDAEDDVYWPLWRALAALRDGWRAKVAAVLAKPPEAPPGPRKGMVVTHPKFGAGQIVRIDGDRVEVAFDTAGHRFVLAQFLTFPNSTSATAAAPDAAFSGVGDIHR